MLYNLQNKNINFVVYIDLFSNQDLDHPSVPVAVRVFWLDGHPRTNSATPFEVLSLFSRKSELPELYFLLLVVRPGLLFQYLGRVKLVILLPLEYRYHLEVQGSLPYRPGVLQGVISRLLQLWTRRYQIGRS